MSYVDGGTMNNEPIREAFRLASFQDAGDERDFDRVIIFVDPFIGADEVDYRIGIHKAYAFDKEAKRLSTRPRLLAHAGNMLTVLTEQVRNNEYDKIHDTLELFRDCKISCEPLFDMIDHLPEKLVDLQLKSTRERVDGILRDEEQNELLPPGAITLVEELIRIRRAHLDHLNLIKIEDIRAYCKDPNGVFPLATRQLLLKAQYAILVNILTGLSGKSNENKIVAIAPVLRDDAGNEKPIFLPGSYLAAFSGFFSPVPNDFAVRLAKYCARDFMKRSKLIPENAKGEIATTPKWTDDEQKLYEIHFEERMKYLKERVANVIVGDNSGWEKIISWGLKTFDTALDKIKLRRDTIENILIYIPVKDEDLIITGEDDSHAVSINGQQYCVTEAKYHIDEQWWEGPHVQPARDLLISKNQFLPHDPKFCRVALPEVALIKKARLHPNPIFTLKKPIGPEDKGKHIPASEWTILPGVTPIEDGLLM
jgi:hypothetical protein